MKPIVLDIPDEMPEEGLVLELDGVRFGAWIMPDNKKSGMIETFAYQLINEDDKEIWTYAQEAALVAKNDKGASWKDRHKDKACIHSFLAWQDPPGMSLGVAITKKTLDPKSPNAKKFVDWFKRLYEL